MKDRERWNKKYREGWRTTLNATLLKFYSLALSGRALDIACGSGDNSLFLAHKGFKVDAFDISEEAIKIAIKEARRRKLTVNFLVCDALSYPFPENTYSLVINLYFLKRELFPLIKRTLKDKGVLIFETYNEKHKSVKPAFNPDFLLKEGELKESFKDLEILHYEESTNVTTLVAKKVSSVS